MAIQKPSNLALTNVNNTINLEWQDNQLSEVLGYKIKRNGVEIATIPQNSVIVKNGITNKEIGNDILTSIDDGSGSLFISTISKAIYPSINSIITDTTKNPPRVTVSYDASNSIVTLNAVNLTRINILNKITSTNNSIKLIFSVDNGTTWKSWDSVTSVWQVVDILNANDVKAKSNAIDIVNGLTSSQLEQLRGSSTSIKIGHFLYINDANKYSNNTLLIEYTNIDNEIVQNKTTYNVSNGSTTSYIDLQPIAGEINTYDVYAFNATEQSLVVSQSILAAPSMPSNLRYTSNGYNITFTWDVQSCDGYKIYDENDVLLNSTSSNSFIYTNNGQNETTKIIKVSAYNSVAESGKTLITGKTIPNTPSNLILSQLSDGFRLEWDNNSILNNGFKIQKRESNGEWTTINQTSETYYVDNFTPQTNVLYEYQVCAYNDEGNSAYTTWGSYVVDSVVLSYTLEDNLNKITYYWDESIGCSGYKLYITNNGVLQEHDITNDRNYVFTINEEVNQTAYVVAYIDDEYGTFTSDNSNEVSVKSSTRNVITDISCNFNNSIATVTFKDNSILEDGFKLKYIIDNGIEQVVDIASTSSSSIGTSYSYDINIENMSESLSVSVAQSNSVGISQYSATMIYVAPPKHIDIAYKNLSNDIKIGWVDTIGLADKYKLEYVLDGIGHEIEVTNNVLDGTDKIYSTTISANANSQFSGYIYPINNNVVGVKSKEVTIDCSSYVVPILTSDLSVQWISDGIAEYSWTNDQSELYGYKFIYTINNGVEQVIDYKVNSTALGDVFRPTVTVYNDLDTISARIQGYTLVDDTNTSNSIEVIYVSVEPVPVEVIKTRTEDGVTLQWNITEFVDSYEVHCIINDIESTITTQSNEYSIEIDSLTVVSLQAYVVVRYTGGKVSIPSNSIYVTPTSNIQNINEVYYNKTEQDDYLNGYFINKRLSTKSAVEIATYTRNTKSSSKLQTTNVTYGVSTNGLISDINFARTLEVYDDIATFYNTTNTSYEINSTTVVLNTLGTNYIETASCQRKLSLENSLVGIISNKQVGTKNALSMNIVSANIKQSNYNVFTTIYVQTKTTVEPINYTIFNKLRFDAGVYTEIHKIRICCIGDSITAGHPGYWAENEVNYVPNSGTGDIKSQYEYWLQRRLQSEYEVINNGYGSDTTERMLNRFDRDILPLNPQYCIIQGGTNDINWAMVESKGNQEYLDAKMETAKQNIVKLIDKCVENKIMPIVGTLIPRTSAQGIYREALWSYNDWIINYCNSRDDVYYADFYNAGKENIPPTPLEEPSVAGNLNPMYDGDSKFDQYGNLTRRGYGVHPNVEGYKIMAEAIPLNMFKSLQTGVKLYIDENCTIEENVGESDIYHSEYNITFNNLDRGRTKVINKYIKNIGNTPILFSIYNTNEVGVDMKFSLDGINYYDIISGKLDNETVNTIYIKVVVPRIGELPKVSTILSTRSIKLIS